MLVLDKSGSMGVFTWDHDSDPSTAEQTRWASLVNVVDGILAGYDGVINFGAQLFPGVDASGGFQPEACATLRTPEVSPALDNRGAIMDALPPADAGERDIHGGTPAASGYRSAVEHLVELGSDVPGYLILVTDGAANCSDELVEQMDIDDAESLYAPFEYFDSSFSSLVEAAESNHGFSTFVVGIDIIDVLEGGGYPPKPDGSPEANTYTALNELAVNGGVPKDDDDSPGELFYNTSNETQLQAAIDEIVGVIPSCRVPLDPPPEPDSIGYVQLWVGGDEIVEIVNCKTESGWMYTSPEGTWNEVGLCGAACERLKETGKVTGVYGCKPEGPEG